MPYEIRGTHQIHRSRTAAARVQAIWEMLSDSRLLPQWVPAVRHVERCAGSGEAVGAVRHCSVEFGGKRGQMVEECVDMVPHVSLTYAVRSDTFGMTRMFTDYCFRISVRADGEATLVAIDTYYAPKNALYALMNLAVMRRQLRGVVDEILAGLCGLAEQRARRAPSE